MASSSSSPKAFPSKPALHNFELPALWRNNQPPKPTNRRRSSSSAVKSQNPTLDSSKIHADSPKPSPLKIKAELDSKNNTAVDRFEKKPLKVCSSKIHAESPLKINNPDLVSKNNTVSDLHPKNTAVSEKKLPVSEKKPASSKIVLKLPPKNNIIKTEATTKEKEKEKGNEQTLMELKREINNGKGKAVVQDEGNNNIDDKVWNLRPRRSALRKCGTRNNNNGDATSAVKNNIIINNNNVNQVVAVAGQNEGRGGGDGDEEETVLTKLDVALNKQEIDDDMFAFTGMKNTKRPRKRHRSVQKKLDYLFPGLGLINVTPEAYNVSESNRKG